MGPIARLAAEFLGGCFFVAVGSVAIFLGSLVFFWVAVVTLGA